MIINRKEAMFVLIAAKWYLEQNSKPYCPATKEMIDSLFFKLYEIVAGQEEAVAKEHSDEPVTSCSVVGKDCG